MLLSVGIVGLPNVGKSTFFNALTKSSSASAQNYPFCTIEPNHSIVQVPDVRLESIAKVSASKAIIPAQLEFVDIAGLVKGASKGEGLGNKFLDNIRNVHAIVHLSRCFIDKDIVHVNSKLDPVTDIEVINTELILADLLRLEKVLDSFKKRARVDKKLDSTVIEIERMIQILESNKLLYQYKGDFSEALVRELQLLTFKPMIYVANVDEAAVEEGNELVRNIEQFLGSKIITISAKIEEEIVNMKSEEDKKMFLEILGNKTGLERIIERAYSILGLISYFTSGEKESRAWTILKGSKAPVAAGAIHSDFEIGFIRAEVVDYKTFVDKGGWVAARSFGKVRSEGKEYIVQDGDIISFLHNK